MHLVAEKLLLPLVITIKIIILNKVGEICCCSITKSCQTLCDPMDCSIPGSILYYLLEFAQIHVYWVGDAGGKVPTCQCRRHERHGFDPWLGRSPGGGHGNPFQYSCLENPMDRGAWRSVVHRVKSQIQLKQLSMHESNLLIIYSPLCIRHFFFLTHWNFIVEYKKTDNKV